MALVHFHIIRSAAMIVDHPNAFQATAAFLLRFRRIGCCLWFFCLFVYDYTIFFFINKTKLSFDKKISATVVVGSLSVYNTQVFVLRRACRCSLVTSFDNILCWGSEREKEMKWRTYRILNARNSNVSQITLTCLNMTKHFRLNIWLVC